MSSDFLCRDENVEACYAVVGPRAADAIGEALRGAFSGDFGLPEDMMKSLRALDNVADRAISLR